MFSLFCRSCFLKLKFYLTPWILWFSKEEAAVLMSCTLIARYMSKSSTSWHFRLITSGILKWDFDLFLKCFATFLPHFAWNSET